MRIGAVFCLTTALLAGTAAQGVQAAGCPGNPNALGTSRTIVVDPAEHPRIGTMQYRETLPLDDHEVVLTFDDGPLPPHTTRVLQILASECVKANFFLIGRMAQQYPHMVREIQAAGHTIGTHSQNHPLTFHKMPIAKAQQEIDEGIASVTAALGDPSEIAPFFRIPGLLRDQQVEDYLASRGLMTWSADFPADDWKHIKAGEVLRRALMRLEAKGKGILLLHDIQPATVLALPELLRELKNRGYRIVHVVPATATLAKTETSPSQWRLHADAKPAAGQWTRVTISVDAAAALPVLPAPSPQSFGIGHPFGPKMMLARPADRPRMAVPPGHVPLPPHTVWPHGPGPSIAAGSRPILPAPSPESFGYDAVETAAMPDRRASLLLRPSRSAAAEPQAETTGADVRGPASTANMPTTGIP
jgi:peptidoglycan/xylan/chitin deacetylase (PgdA/CDA1 family)